MKKVHKLSFGQHITVTHKLKRDCELRHREYYKKWNVLEMKPKTVIVIGKRTLHNGITHFDHEDGTWFEYKEVVHAYLVVEKMNTKPFYIEYL